MKKGIAILLTFLLLPGLALGEGTAPFTPPELQELTAEYPLSQLYEDLCHQWGPFRSWSIEQKAWFSHWLRGQYGYISEIPGDAFFGPEVIGLSFDSFPMLAHLHGLPGPEDIGQEQAIEMGRAHLEALGLIQPGDPIALIDSYFFVDDLNRPQWVFRFYQKGAVLLGETCMDARTGAFSQSLAADAVAAAKEYLLEANILVAQQPLTEEKLALYTVCTYFDPGASTWLVHFEGPQRDQRFLVTVKDETLQVMEEERNNG